MFIVFYSGDRARNKIMKISEAFGANKYPFTEDLGKQLQITKEVCFVPLLFQRIMTHVNLKLEDSASSCAVIFSTFLSFAIMNSSDLYA